MPGRPSGGPASSCPAELLVPVRVDGGRSNGPCHPKRALSLRRLTRNPPVEPALRAVHRERGTKQQRSHPSPVNRARRASSARRLIRSSKSARLTRMCPFAREHLSQTGTIAKGLSPLLPLDGSRRLRRDVEHHSVDAGDLVGDAVRDAREHIVGKAGPVGGHCILR